MKEDICGIMWKITYPVKCFIAVSKDFMVMEGNKQACFLCS